MAAAMTATLVALSVPSADALTTTTLEAEIGVLVSSTCGAGSGVTSDLSRTAVAMVGDGCKITFDDDSNWRRPRAAVFKPVSGCGRFHLSGAFVSTTGDVCSGNPYYYTMSFGAQNGDGGGDFTLEWDVTSGSPTTGAASLDYVALRAVEAEEGTIVNSLCGELEPMRVDGSGPDATVVYTASGCSQTFSKENNVTPSGAVFSVPGGSTACGFFEFTGAYVGTTSTRCGSGESWVPATLVSGVGTTYTVTWRTYVGTPTTQNASLNYLSFR